MVMSQLVTALPPYEECGQNKTEADKKTCQDEIVAGASAPGCAIDMKRFLCLGGARPCNAEDNTKRASGPCAWCQKMVSGKPNACSPNGAFSFSSFYSFTGDQKNPVYGASSKLCYDMGKELTKDPDTVKIINALPVLLDQKSLKSKRGQPAVNVVGMLVHGMNSALKGCGPKNCPVKEGMAADLWSTEESMAPQKSCAATEAGPAPGANAGSSTGVALFAAAVSMMMLSLSL